MPCRHCDNKVVEANGLCASCNHLGGRRTKLNAVDTFMAVCKNCHDLIHNKLSAAERREKKLML
jgi:predicted HNH restriction endonuclease